MHIASLGYVGVGSPRAHEWETFGPQILGTPVSSGEDGTVYVRLDERAYRLALHPSSRDELRYIGWEVAGPPALQTAANTLHGAKLAFEWGSPEEHRARQVERLLRFRDPWGMAHEIFYGQKSFLSFRPTREISGFVTGELGMGHVVLAVPDLEEAARFYVDVMGFRLSDLMDVPFPLAFFHCNPRHHSLAVAQVGPVRGLHHVMIEVRDLNDVGTTYELCRKQGIPFTMDLGRHSNDHMFSFYVRTPTGFEIEYGWGGRLVDDRSWQVVRLPTPSFWGHEFVNPNPPTTIEPFPGS